MSWQETAGFVEEVLELLDPQSGPLPTLPGGQLLLNDRCKVSSRPDQAGA